jgi:hypothetical protein
MPPQEIKRLAMLVVTAEVVAQAFLVLWAKYVHREYIIQYSTSEDRQMELIVHYHIRQNNK